MNSPCFTSNQQEPLAISNKLIRSQLISKNSNGYKFQRDERNRNNRLKSVEIFKNQAGKLYLKCKHHLWVIQHDIDHHRNSSILDWKCAEQGHIFQFKYSNHRDKHKSQNKQTKPGTKITGIRDFQQFQKMQYLRLSFQTVMDPISWEVPSLLN